MTNKHKQGENYPAGEIEDSFVEEIIVEDGGIGYNEDEDFEIPAFLRRQKF